MPIDLGSGVTVQVEPPTTPTSVVVPIAGPQGPQGPPGDSSEVLGFQHTQSSPVMLVQIIHNLPYKPAGIVCIATGDAAPLIGWSVAHPAAGITEVTFGVPFTGDIYVS